MDKLRITPEQIEADSNLLEALENSLKEWQSELAWTQKALIDQALIDGKSGEGKSNRYKALEKVEAELKEKISNASTKHQLINVRYAEK